MVLKVLLSENSQKKSSLNMDDCEFTIVLCSDTDVFDFAPKPPIKWDEVKKDLANSGAAKVIHVQAKRSI